MQISTKNSIMRSQKATFNNELNPPSTHLGDAHSYIGKLIQFNHHQILVEDVLGQGGFAYVFRVRTSNQQRYALKRMYVNNQRDLIVCQREINLLKELSSHRNIIKYVDHSIHQINKSFYANSEDTIYEILLLTEYCLNGALITRLNEQRSLGINLAERQIVRIFADVCNAVSACHFRRPESILHRDIKLENILIDSQQNSILCDFGSAILLSDNQQYRTEQLSTNVIQELAEDIQRYTTLSYRAPELVDLYSRIPITLKVDIWAMGCLLYKLMYNQMPFGESILAIQNGVFVLPDDLANEHSRDLNLLVRYILEIDIDKRPDIWQVSYLTYKLLGSDCPIPNRCQSKIPDLKNISMPLTDSEYRHQRTAHLTKSKSTNLTEESSTHGTDINPRERPRGFIPSSTSLINFSQRTNTLAVPPPPSAPVSTPTTTRSGSGQLMFDDDFGQVPSHAISLTNLPSGDLMTSNKRSSPPVTISAASGLALQQQLFPQSQTNMYGHRRSASQTNVDETKKSQISLLDEPIEEQRANPFLHAPFHHSPLNKQNLPTATTMFDPNSIVNGKRTSAFTAFQKPESNADVFTNAPFRMKSKTKQSDEQTNVTVNKSFIDEYF